MENESTGTAIAQEPQTQTNATGALGTQQVAVADIERGMRSGASWFFWIAGLTMVNTGAAVIGTDWRFLLGLGITQIADGLAADMGSVGKVAAFVVDALAIAFFVLMGVFANKAQKWAFILGMIAFTLDTGISVLAQDVVGVIFHIFALWCIYRGYTQVQKLKDLKDFGVMPTA